MDTEEEEEMSKVPSMDKQRISRLLKFHMETILRDDKFKELKHLDTNTMAIAMDLNIMNQKIDNQLYDNLGAFLFDILYIKHHYATEDQNSPVLGTVHELMKYCESELKNIISCAECYGNKHTKSNWRSLPCSKPHLILWVKLDDKIATADSLRKGDIPYWPAKLLSVDDNAANVIFFGYSELVKIPTENCFLYSTEAPQSPTQTHKSKDFEDALKEVDLYKQNIRQKFGRFEDQSKSIPFNPNRLDEHMRDIFPDYRYDSTIDYGEVNVEVEDTDESKESGLNSKQNCGLLGCESIAENGSPQTTKRKARSNDHESEGDTEKECNDNDDDFIPNKIQCLSVNDNDADTASNPTLAPSTDSFNGYESISNQNDEPPGYDLSSTIQKELCQAMQNITNIATNFEQQNMLTIQTLRKELEDLKKSYDESQLKNVELLDRLNAVTGERNQANLNAKNEVAKIKVEHALGMTALNELRNQEAAVAKTEMEKVKQNAHDLLVRTQKQHQMELDLEKQRVSAATEKLALEHEKVAKLEHSVKTAIEDKSKVTAKIENMERDKESLRSKLQATIYEKQQFYEETAELKREIKNMKHNKQHYDASIWKLKINQNRELNEIRRKYKLELNSERQRASAATEKLKRERGKVMQLENDVRILKRNHRNDLDEICRKHKLEPNSERQRSGDATEKFKKEHEKNTALQDYIKSTYAEMMSKFTSRANNAN